MLRQKPSRARITVAALAAGLAGVLSGSSPAAPPLFANATGAGTSAAATSLTVVTPAGAGAGHLLVAAVAVRHAGGVTASADWTEVVRTTCSGNDGIVLTQVILVRAATGAEPGSFVFTAPAATGGAGAIVAYAGVDAQEPVLASGGQIRRNSRLVTAPSVATTVADALAVGVFANTGRSSIAAPPGMTSRIAAAGSPDLRLTAADEIRAAAGPTGERTAESTQTSACAVGQLLALRPAPDAPTSTTPPQVSGTAQEGRVLSATTGAWASGPTSYGYRWQRADGAGWVDIAGAAAADYTPAAADVGWRLRVVVTASNSGGSGTAASEPTAPVLPAAPVNTTRPAVTGDARELATLTADPGAWSGSPTLGYEWQRSADGQAWEAVSGSESYAATAADVGRLVRVAVTGTNAGGSTVAYSAPVGPVEPSAPPTVLTAPSIGGWAQDGEPLLATTGTWTGSPTAFALSWERSADGVAWAQVEGAEAASYLLGPADVGSLLRVVVTATNAAGPGTASSEPVGPIGAAVPPSNVEPPGLTGVPVYGVPFQATTGVWANAPHTYEHRWRRSADDGVTWIDIEGAESASYTPTDLDVGLRLAVVVTAANGNGSTSATSAASEPVLPPPPVGVSPPVLAGDALEGAILVASTGEWLNAPTSYDYEWQRCDAVDCTAIRWETSADYTVRDDDVGFAVRAVVTASNAAGSATAATAPTATVLPLPPVNEELPELGGVPAQGETLTASTGSWESAAAIAYGFRWERSADDGVTWSDVSAAGPAYVLTADDVGSVFRVVVTATNAGGATEAISAVTAVVALPGVPTNVVAPVISGVVQERGRLNALPGTWSGSPTFAYAWQRSSDDGVTWINVPRGQTARYTAVAADVGRLLRVLVTATNGHGSTTVAAGAWLIFPLGNRHYLVNSTWYCDTAVALDLVRVTITDGQFRDAIRFDNCSGRIGRVEVDTNGVDGLKVRNTEPVAHDLVVESGYVRCTGHPEGSHQDGIQVLGGARITFSNLVVWCGSPDIEFGGGVNSSALIATGGAGAATTPTDVVIEHSVLGPGTANGVLVEHSLRSGVRDSVACPDWTAVGGPVLIGADAVDGIDLDNEKPGLEDPRCTSFEAALAWVQP